jgi:tRNA-guanine family transglycosylase
LFTHLCENVFRLIRSLRWLDRCIAAHARPNEQSLFPIVQGGLDEKLREQSVKGSLFLSD